MRLITSFLLVLSACSHAASTPTPVAAAEPKRAKDPCREAEKLRRSGFTKLLDLDLKGARLDFNTALELDPGNTGALQQLQVIDAMESGNSQVGAAEANSRMSSQVTRTHCSEAAQTETASKPHTMKVPARGVADVDGQIGMTSAGHDSAKITTSVVHAAVQKVRPEITICYQRALNREVSLHGNVVLKFTINDDGHIQSAPQTEDSTLGDSEMESCVEKIVAGLTFPRTKGSAHFVSYPISFR